MALVPLRSGADTSCALDAELVRCACALAPVRWALAKMARRLIATRAWERLGYARLRDYAVERLGLSARSLHDLAHVDHALTTLPRIERAFLTGAIPWTTARLLARVATPADEGEWVARARRMTAAALAHEVRKVDVGALEGGGHRGPDAEDDSATAYDNLQIRCAPRVAAKWHRARQLVWWVVGHPVPPWECAELVAAEVLSALPIDRPDGSESDPELKESASGETEDLDATSRANGERGRGIEAGSGRISSGEAASPTDAGAGVAAVERLLAPGSSLVENLDSAGPFELDRRLCRAVRLEQRLDAALGARLAVAAHEHLHLTHGLPSFEAYVRERLGLAPRKVRALLRLERAGHLSPTLASAYRAGRLSWVQAHALVPVLLIAHARPYSDVWIGWATQVSVRRLEEDVDRALLLNETDPEAFARTAGLPGDAFGGTADAEGGRSGAERSPERQIGAQLRDTAETSRLFVHAPRAVTRLVRAVLCTMRRACRRTARPSRPCSTTRSMLGCRRAAGCVRRIASLRATAGAAPSRAARHSGTCTIITSGSGRPGGVTRSETAPRSAPGTICAASTPASCVARARHPTDSGSSWGSGAVGRRW